MKEVFDALADAYAGSTLEAIAGVDKFFSYDVPEGSELPYVVSSMVPSKVSRPMSRPIKVAVHVFITPNSAFGEGPRQVNEMKDAVLETYDGARLKISGYRLVNIEPVELQQVLDDEDPDNKLWLYPVKFKIEIEKE